MTVLHGMQKEQFSSFEKLEAVVDEAQHSHVEIRTQCWHGPVYPMHVWHAGFFDFRDTLNYESLNVFFYSEITVFVSLLLVAS